MVMLMTRKARIVQFMFFLSESAARASTSAVTAGVPTVFGKFSIIGLPGSASTVRQSEDVQRMDSGNYATVRNSSIGAAADWRE